MSRNGFTDAQRARCVIWMAEGYGLTAIQRLLRDEYSTTPPAHSTIRVWQADYRKGEIHTHSGGNGCPEISARTKNRIRQLFEDNPRMSLHAVEAKTGVAHATFWNFLRK